MEVCKNKRSGKYFIFINEVNTDEALLLTPDAQIKLLKLNLFEYIEEYSENYLLEKNMINEEQIKKFHEYNRIKSENLLENLDYDFEQMSPYEQKKFIKFANEIIYKNNA